MQKSKKLYTLKIYIKREEREGCLFPDLLGKCIKCHKKRNVELWKSEEGCLVGWLNGFISMIDGFNMQDEPEEKTKDCETIEKMRPNWLY